MKDVVSLLKEIEEFQNVPEEQLSWLIERSKCQDFKLGDHLFEPGSAIDRLLIVLSGSFHVKAEQNGQFRTITEVKEKTITGMLPYSRATTSRAYAETTVPGTVMVLHKDSFPEMIKECHELTTALVHIMSSRIRRFTKQQQQDEKMMSLGKLSAGLAHELNNPSAAVVRSAQELKNHLGYVPDKFKKVMLLDLNEGNVDKVNGLIYGKIEKGMSNMSLMDRSEREDELLDFLDDLEVEDSEEVASNLVDYGFEQSDLELIAEETGEDQFGIVMNWVSQVLTTEKLVEEIEDASQRINNLVSSVKGYTHMDQAPEKVPTDVRIGIDSTLTMLNHKLKSGKISVVKNYDEKLNEVELLAGPMNQVWTNLIDNAIDAMENSDTKELTINTIQKGNFANISIVDSGSGIPEDVIDKIFDPFFTTKAVGKGTGLGLEFVLEIIKSQHNGTINVDSKPGKTEFLVCLPIKNQA